jgi:hypothetical protein
MQNAEQRANPPLDAKEAASFLKMNSRTLVRWARCGYPAAFAAECIRPAVRLEIGPLASWVPSSSHRVKAYAAEAFPEAFLLSCF